MNSIARGARAGSARSSVKSAVPRRASSSSLRVLIVPDKFKGTLTAGDAAAAMARGWAAQRPQDRLQVLPMSDGGDGFGTILSRLLSGRAREVGTVDAAHRPCQATWWWEARSRTAVIESATVIGLANLPAGKYHPRDLDTYGLGRLVQAAARAGARRCIFGIGGSATNDGGFGLARALGWRFEDRRGRVIERWDELDRLARVNPPRKTRWFRELLVAVDVQNPLLGKAGATRVYGPQKGLRPADFAGAEACLGRLARVMAHQFGENVGSLPGVGAAGGLGFGLCAFLGAELVPGFDLFSRFADLEHLLGAVDLVVTGEGRIDASSAMGKGVGELARRCYALGVPCLGLAGTVQAPAKSGRLFAAAYGLTDLTTVEQAKAAPAAWLELVAAKAARDWRPSGSRQAEREG